MGAAQLVLEAASKQLAIFLSTQGLVGAVLKSSWLWLGLAIYTLAIVFWLFILYRVDVRIAYPVAVTSVVFAALFKSIIESTMPSATYFFGLFLILLGLMLINGNKI